MRGINRRKSWEYSISRPIRFPTAAGFSIRVRLVVRRGFEIGRGERFVVAEDVVTRGGRVQETIDIVEKAGGVVSAVAVLVNRSGGKASFKQPFFSLLEMEPVTYEPAACPLCKRGEPLAHPGSKSPDAAKA